MACITLDRVSCDKVGNIQNGHAEYIDGDREYGAQVQYQCVTGYEITAGGEFRTCQSNEEWSGTAPKCQIINCDAISVPMNGMSDSSITTYGSTITFSCNIGYKLIGNDSITCQANKEWNGSVPTCENESDCGSDCISTTGK